MEQKPASLTATTEGAHSGSRHVKGQIQFSMDLKSRGQSLVVCYAGGPARQSLDADLSRILLLLGAAYIALLKVCPGAARGANPEAVRQSSNVNSSETQQRWRVVPSHSSAAVQFFPSAGYRVTPPLQEEP